MARPPGFKPGTLGLEGPMSDRLYQDGYIRTAVACSDVPHSSENLAILLAAGLKPDNRLANRPSQCRARFQSCARHVGNSVYSVNFNPDGAHAKTQIAHSSVRRVWAVALDADLSRILARPDDVIRTLHSQQRVHLHAERLFDAQSHLTGQVGMLVQ